MRYWKLFGVAIVAVCALGAALSVSAFALPEILPTTITSFTGKSDTGKVAVLETTSGSTVKCKTATSTGNTVESNHHLGLFHIQFEECSAESSGLTAEHCTGLGDKENTILSLGSWHLVYDTLTPTLGAAMLFLLGAVHFVCTFPIVGAQLILVPLGAMVLCLIENPTALSTTFLFTCEKQATGVTKESKYYNEGGTLVSIHRNESATNEGTAEEAVESASGTVEYPTPALLMI